jgi:predicted metal-dependent enzyme (double-stranded beta helix superfamily)
MIIANTCKVNVMKAIAARNTAAVMRSSTICCNHFSSVAYQKNRHHYQDQDQDQDQDYDKSQSSSSSSSSFLNNVSSSSSKWNNKKIINNNNNNNNNSKTTSSNTTNTNTKICHIQDFIDEIPDAVNRRKIENIEPGAFDDPVARLFRRSELPTEDWLKYAIFNDDKPYTRNLISTDNETYTLLVLCWNPEKESPIHDHPSDGCWLQVLDGGINEVRYDKELSTIADLDYSNGELSYITDNIGYHKISSNKKRAVTLHLYAPPFETCHCWYSDTANPLEPCIGHNINHSEYGVVKEEADIAA